MISGALWYDLMTTGSCPAKHLVESDLMTLEENGTVIFADNWERFFNKRDNSFNKMTFWSFGMQLGTQNICQYESLTLIDCHQQKRSANSGAIPGKAITGVSQSGQPFS